MNDQLYDYKTNPDGVSGAYLDAQRRNQPDHRTYEQRILATLEAIQVQSKQTYDVLVNMLLEIEKQRLPSTPPVETSAKPVRRK